MQNSSTTLPSAPAEISAGKLAEFPEGSTMLVDVRTPPEFEAVHIAEAKNIPLNTLPSSQSNLAAAARDGGVTVCLICQSGARARKAADMLVDAGIPGNQVTVLQGGVAAWEKEGRPVIQGQRKTIPLEAQVRIAAGTVVLTGIILSFLIHPLFILVSAFAGAGLIFSGISGLCLMANLLATMPWNRGTK